MEDEKSRLVFTLLVAFILFNKPLLYVKCLVLIVCKACTWPLQSFHPLLSANQRTKYTSDSSTGTSTNGPTVVAKA